MQPSLYRDCVEDLALSDVLTHAHPLARRIIRPSRPCPGRACGSDTGQHGRMAPDSAKICGHLPMKVTTVSRFRCPRRGWRAWCLLNVTSGYRRAAPAVRGTMRTGGVTAARAMGAGGVSGCTRKRGVATGGANRAGDSRGPRSAPGKRQPLLSWGGRGGIRTLEAVLPPTRFPVARTRPGYATLPCLT